MFFLRRPGLLLQYKKYKNRGNAPWIGLVFLLLTGAVNADSEAPVSEIPHQDFFSNSKYTDVVISPDGTFYAIKTDAGDRDRIVIVKRADNSISSSFELGEYQRFSSINWVNNERFIFKSRKRVGLWDEQESPPNLYAANADGSNRRELFAWGRSGFELLSLMPEEPDYIMINKYHFADDGETKAHMINVNDARSSFMGDQPPRANQLIADNAGNLRLSVYYDESSDDDIGKGEFLIYYKSLSSDKWEKLDLEGYKKGDSVNFYGFSADNRYAYFGSDIDSKVQEVYRFDTNDLKVTQVTKNSVAEVANIVKGPNGNIIGFDFVPGKVERVYIENSQSTKLMKSLESAFPNQEVSVTSTTANGEQAVVFVRSARDPGTYYLFNTDSLKVSFIAAPQSQLDPSQLADVEPVELSSRDGMKLRGYLTLPVGSKKGDSLPMIVKVHGGPYGVRDTWRFDPENQFFANRGYAVLQVNFRGSGGYGKEFLEAGYREWGKAMQDDVTDATLWAIEQGYADRDKVCIYGGSYGGYAALMGAAKEPELYQCTVGYVGVYSLPLMYEEGDIAARDSGRKYLKEVLGEDEEELRENSPVNLVENIKAEVLLVHGARDVRVPIEHMTQLTAAFDEINKPYKKIVNEEEGHGFQKEENKFELYPQLIKFFDTHIGN